MKFFGIFILLSIFACSQVMADRKSGIIPLQITISANLDIGSITDIVIDRIVNHKQLGQILRDADAAAIALKKL